MVIPPIFAVMLTADQINTLIELRLREIPFPQTPVGLYDPARYILNGGGKHIRPTLAMLSSNLFTDDLKPCEDVALAMEVFHNFTLVHDDIMDNAPTRRGRATIHEKWDLATGILSGDALLIKAYQLLSGIKKERLAEVLNMFNDTALKVCEGQQLDMDFETKTDVVLEDYITMITGKTSVLLGCSLYCGALAGGSDEENAKLLYEAGIKLGNSFQIQDDVLDAFGDEKKFGKKPGGDIVQNKKTFLILTALKKANLTDIEHLKYLYSKKPLDEQNKIDAVMEVFIKYNIQQDAELEMQKQYDAAIALLKKVNVAEERKENLYQFLEYIFKRSY